MSLKKYPFNVIFSRFILVAIMAICANINIGYSQCVITLTIPPAQDTLCIDAGIQAISNAGSPSGGVYSGAGVTDDANGFSFNFDPVSSGPGFHEITYTYDDGLGCSGMFTDFIQVFDLPIVTFSIPAAKDTFCIDAPAESISMSGAPPGGVYSGPGITDNGDGVSVTFDPAAAGVGFHVVTYTFTDANGCSNSFDDFIHVFDLPVVTFTALADLCIDAGLQAALGGASPTGGVYSGSGVTDNGDDTYDFDPAVAGVGVHTITYDYTDAIGCSNSASDDVEVFDLPVVMFTALADLCIDAGVQAAQGGGTPTGGVYSGPGVTDNGNGIDYDFDPAAAGVGVHTITYDYTDANGCSGSASDDVEVFDLPVVMFTALADLCIDAGVQAAQGGGTPTGGVYSGPGVIDDANGMTYSFDPATAGVGVHTITYDYTDANGCTSSASDDVEVFALPVVMFTALADICINEGVQAGQGGGTPTGGVYSGPGVTDDGNGMTYSFDPEAAGAGTHTISYDYTDGNGCMSSASDDVEVFGLSILTFTAPADLCVNAGVQAGLNGGTPPGGVYSGPGVTDNGDDTYDFDPAVAGVGIHSITYTFVDLNGCSTSISDDVEVLDLPTVMFTALADLCIDGGVQAGQGGGTPTGGIYSGPGVTDDANGMTYSFDPAAAGVGVHTLTYDYTDANGCTNSASDDVEVFDLPVVAFTALADLCVDAGVQAGQTGGTPTGGVYSGVGVTDDGNGMTYSFDPAAAGVGVHTITYDYTDGNGCMNSASDDVEVFDLPVVEFTAPMDVCVDAGVQSGLDGGTPMGGVYSGVGVTDDGNGMTFSFDPAAAGVGVHTITYDYTDANGCSNSASDDIEVFDLPSVSFTALADLCIDAGVQAGSGSGVPGGGVYSGPGVTDDGNGMTYSFDPAAAGVGVHTITYTYNDTNGCTGSFSDDVEVFDLPVVMFTALADQCVNAGVQAGLSGGTPTGGTYSGSGVTDDGNGMTYSFDPASAGVGVHTLTYEYTDGNGCVNSASDDVEVFDLPVVEFMALDDLCIDAGVQAGQGGGTPTGGLYGGPGVTDDGNGMTYSFDPAAAGVGLHLLTYGYTDNNGCNNFNFDEVEVFDLPVVTFTALADLCINEGIQTGLSGGTPTGGVYSGTGVTDDGNGMTYSFDPTAAGAGVYTITYTYTDPNGCVNFATDDVEVFGLTIVTFTAPADLCASDGIQTGLNGGAPTGGTYSGTGVTDDGNGMTYSFDPVTAGAGVHTITYTFTDANGCTNSASDDIEVFDPIVEFTAPSDLCIDGGVQAGLSGGTPAGAGGVYSGTGVTDDGNGMTYSFDPATAGVGVHTITYDYTDANGCMGTASDDVEVFDLPIVDLVTESFHCLDAAIQSLPMTGGIPSGGVYSGVGITDNGNGISYFIDPMVNGVGTVTVTYTYTDPNGCTSSAMSDIEVVECGLINDFEPSDPCSCLDNATPFDCNNNTGGDDGQFSEIVSISGVGGPLPNGMTWSIVGATGALDAFNVPAVGTQSAGVAVPGDGSVLLAYNTTDGIYEVPFVHVDDMGYTLTIEGPFAMGSAANVTLTISNKCQYPDPVFDPAIPLVINTDDPIIVLGAMDTNGGSDEGVTYTVDGNPETQIDPSMLALGFHTVIMTYDGLADGNGGISPDGGTTSASPGCIQDVEKVFEIVDCDLVVDCSNIADDTLACRADLPPVDFSLPIIVDSCGDITLAALTIIPGDSGCPGDTLFIPRTYFIQDDAGNMTECMQTFTIISTMDPTFTFFPSDTMVACGTSTDPTATGTAVGAQECTTATSMATVVFADVVAAGSCPEESTITRTWTVTDACGRSVDMDQIINVIDTVAPVVTCMSATLFLDENGMVTLETADIDDGTSDNCSTFELSLSQEDFTCDDIGDNDVTLTATDACGNVSSCDAVVTISDNLPPTAMCQNVSVFLDGNGMASIEDDGIDNGSNDNCTEVDDLIFALSQTEFSCADLDQGSTSGQVVVTMTVTDEAGNSSMCEATVTVIDDMAPVVSCWGDQVITLTDGACGEYVNYNQPIVFDNCPGDYEYEVISGPITGDFLTPDDSPYTVVLRVTNTDRGDFGECEFTITVNGVVDPIGSLSCNSNINISLDENCQAVITADMILEGGGYGCYEDFLIIINDTDTLFNDMPVTEVGTYQVTVYDPVSGNSCWGTVNVEDKLPPVVDCPCSNPITALTQLTGFANTDFGSPEFMRTGTFNQGGNCTVTAIADHVYDANPIQVSADGNYTFTASWVTPPAVGFSNPSVTIYEAPFDPTQPCVNAIASGIGNETADLLAGVDYVIVFFDFQSNQVGGGDYVVDITTTSNGFVFVGDPACNFLCYEIDAIYNSTVMTPNPVADQGSCNDITSSFSDRLEEVECGTSTITRSWIFTDASGNTTTCNQIFNINNIGISNLTLPPAVVTLGCGADLSPQGVATYYDVDTRRTPILEDDDYTETPDVIENNEGIAFAYPHYMVVGFDGNPHAQPVDTKVCELIATYSDQVLDACAVGCHGNSKVIRDWTLVDWCTTEIQHFTQIIKSVDEDGPTFDLEEQTVSTRPWDCTAEFTLLPPNNLHDACDISPTYYVTGPAGVVISGNATDGYVASGAPKGEHTFTYTAEDCCGNPTSIDVTITVLDQVAPVASSKQDIVIALTPAGPGFESSAKLFTNQVNNFSYDACTDVHIEIRRNAAAPMCGNEGAVINATTGERYNNNVTFNDASPRLHADDDRNDTDGGQFVKFCCEDLTTSTADVDGDGTMDEGYHEVVMRVWDDANMTGVYGDVDANGHSDNYNEIWAYVLVEDNLPPVITCPVDATISCYWAIDLSTDYGAGFQDASQANFDKTGTAVAYSTCTVEDIEFSDRLNLDDCGVGTIRRTWRASKEGKNGPQTSQCIQNITVEAAESVFNVTPPTGQPFSVGECEFDVDNIAANQKPSVEGGICDVIGENVEVAEFLFEDGVCKSWVVTYNYYNWCTGENMGPFDVKYIYEDTEAPTIECADTCYSTDANCEYTLALSKSAIDTSGCTDAGWLKWHVTVDTWADGTPDYVISTYAVNPSNGRNITTWATNDDLAARFGLPTTVQWLYVGPTASGQNFASTALPEDLGGKYSKHIVTYKVTDGCHNFSSCVETIEIADKKAPTPYCLSLSTALMAVPAGGSGMPMVELWACDFNQGSFDNCSPQEDLMYTFDNIPFVVDTVVRAGAVFLPVNVDIGHYFDENGFVDFNGDGGLYPVAKAATLARYNNGEIQKWIPETLCAGKVFTCADAPQTDIVMSVWDKQLNVDFCNVFLTFGGQVNDCDPTNNRAVSGNVSTMLGSGVEGVEVAIEGLGLEKRITATDTDGDYVFTNVSKDLDASVTPSKDGDDDNGVSTLDLVLIQRHILNINTFTSPYHVIAADINDSETVTGADVVELRKLILGVTDEFENNTSWRFVDGSQVLDASDAFPYREDRFAAKSDVDQTDINFVGVKIGDVNNSAEVLEGRSGSKVGLLFDNQSVKQGQITEIVIGSEDYRDAYGYQFTLDLNGLELVDIKSNDLTMSTSNIAVLDKNTVTVSYHSVEAQSASSLFTLVVKASKAGSIANMMNVSSKVTKAEAYTKVSGNAIRVSEVSLSARGVEAYDLYQNEPNPFKDQTIIGWNMAQAGNATITVYDVAGRTLSKMTGDYAKGSNTLTLNRADLNGVSGVLYYKLEAGDYTSTKKMILID